MLKMYVEKIRQTFDPKYFDVYAMYDCRNVYLFAMKSKDLGPDEEPDDPWYYITKDTKKIGGFVPFENKEDFNYALKHPIYNFKKE